MSPHGSAILLTAACLTALVLAAGPALLFLGNLRQYRRPLAPAGPQTPPSVSVLIPARDEEISIAAAVQSALASRGVDLELIVLDDHSHAVIARACLDTDVATACLRGLARVADEVPHDLAELRGVGVDVERARYVCRELHRRERLLAARDLHHLVDHDR